MTLYFTRTDKIKTEETGSIYEFLGTKRMLFLNGPIAGMHYRSDAFSSGYIIDALIALDIINSDPIWLMINSPGGLIDEGMALLDTIQLLRSPVYTVGRSVSSMATLILAVGAIGHRYLLPHSSVMLHLPASSGREGDSEDAAIHAKQLGLAKNTMVDILIQHGATKTKKKILTDINRDFWMGSKEAIEYGVADEILKSGMLPYNYPQSMFNVPHLKSNP